MNTKSKTKNIEDIPDEVFLKKGQMEQSPFGMKDVERKQWEENAHLKVKEYLFSIEQPLVYRKDGKIVIESKDGEIN
jgi:hypothetical protein